MKTALPFLAVAVALSGAACTHSVHQLSVGGRPLQAGEVARAQPISATGEQFVFIATGNTDYVEEAWQKLQAACVGGEITAVQARWSTSHGFFSWTNRVHLTGTCVR